MLSSAREGEEREETGGEEKWKRESTRESGREETRGEEKWVREIGMTWA